MKAIKDSNLEENYKITKNGEINTCTINEGIEFILGGDFTNHDINLIIFPNTVSNINQMPKFGGIKIKVNNDNPHFDDLKENLYRYHRYEYNEGEKCFIFNKVLYDIDIRRGRRESGGWTLGGRRESEGWTFGGNIRGTSGNEW